MHPPGHESIHLTYCSNIHPGEAWEEVFQQLDRHIPRLKREFSHDAPFGIGLRLGKKAADTLNEPDEMRAFKRWLSENDCYVFTLNGFPYGSFHGEVVKDRVYEPDWRTRERVAYTEQLIDILAELLPGGMEGSISTSPISYKPWLDASSREEAFRKGAIHLAELTAKLARLRDDRDIFIHLGIEPEPDCLIENTAETVDFFQQWLFADGADWLAEELECPADTAIEHLRQHVRVCYDTCHFAIAYEDPSTTFDRFEEAGIQLSKVQLSAALKVHLQKHRADELRAALEPFAESTYLHQVVEKQPSGALRHYRDLPEVLKEAGDETGTEWRIHYHVPLFVDSYGNLQSTRPELADALAEVLRRGGCTHFEIETYTWDVLPADLRTDMGNSIKREFDWVLSRLD